MSSTSKPTTIKTTTNNLITINDGTSNPMPSAIAYINPVQDLHGYDYPWLGGDGKNKLNITADTVVLHAYIDNSGQIITGNLNNYYCNQYIPVKSNTAYTFSASQLVSFMSIMEYNSNKTFIKRTLGGASGTTEPQLDNLTVTTTSSTAYILIGSNIYYSEISINTVLGINWQVEEGSAKTTWTPYSNICPISGYTSADLFVRGKNLLRPMFQNNQSSVTYSGLTLTFENGKLNASGKYTGTPQGRISQFRTDLFFIKKGNYVMTWTDTTNFSSIRLYDENNNVIYPINITKDQYVYFAISPNNATTYNFSQIGFQLELGDTASDYTPYNSQSTTPTITWQDTVYSGNVDLVSGALSDKTVGAVFNGSNKEQWLLRGNGASTYFSIAIGDYGTVVRSSIISNEYVTVDTINNQNTVIGINCGNSSQYNTAIINVRPANVDGMTVAQFKALLAQNPLQVVYELSEPIQTQLSGQEVRTLSGVNNIWSDCNGDSKITYYGLKDMFTDIKSYYDNNKWDKLQVKYAVTNEWITEAQYETITGETYVAPEYTSPTLLPSVSTNENGKIMKVITDEWELSDDLIPVETEEVEA